MFRVKICGVTCPEDALLCVNAGADAVGLNFYEPSPRCIDIAMARRISKQLPSSVVKVGVFVNASVDEMAAVFDEVGLDLAQLHGDEPPEAIAEMGRRPVVKAFRCRDHDGQQIVEFLRGCRDFRVQPAALLIDAFAPGSYGGTGIAVDWAFVAELGQLVDQTPIALAGGLCPDNVAEAIRIARPEAVDTASGVETAPGKKNPDLTRLFVLNARAAFDRLPGST